MTGAAVSTGGDGRASDAGAVTFGGGARLILGSVVVGVVSLALVAVGAVFDPRQAAFSYLMAFVFWHTLAFGGLIHLMIQHAINASWAVVVRRIAEGAAATFPILLVLALPLIAGVDLLYPWVQPPVGLEGEPERLARILHRRAYLNLPFFYLRTAAYFAVWIAIGWLLQRWTLRQAALAGGEDVGRERGAEGGGGGYGEGGADRDGRETMSRGPESQGRRRALAHRQRVLSALGLPLVAFAVTFAALDWVLTLEPEWFSTIFGVYYFSGAALSFVALLIILAFLLQRHGYLGGVVTISHYHALGKLLLVFVIFWGYIAFAQFLLIWIGNIPREAEWYVIRSRGSWAVGAALLVLGHFALPFFALLSWRLKRSPAALAVVSGWIVLMHFVDIYWLVMPALHRWGMAPHWLDLAALIGVGGIVLGYGVWRFRGRPVAPVGDPRYLASREFYTT